MGTKFTIDFEDPTNLKDVVGVGYQSNSVSHYQGLDINVSNWNDTNNPGCFRTLSVSQANTSPADGYLRAQMRLQIDFGSLYYVDMLNNYHLDGYSYYRPVFTSSNPIIFSGDESGEYTMELMMRFNSSSYSNTGTAYGRTEVFTRALYAP